MFFSFAIWAGHVSSHTQAGVSTILEHRSGKLELADKGSPIFHNLGCLSVPSVWENHESCHTAEATLQRPCSTAAPGLGIQATLYRDTQVDQTLTEVCCPLRPPKDIRPRSLCDELYPTSRHPLGNCSAAQSAAFETLKGKGQLRVPDKQG